MTDKQKRNYKYFVSKSGVSFKETPGQRLGNVVALIVTLFFILLVFIGGMIGGE